MRILFITPYVPSPVRVRPYHFLRVLAEQGHLLEVIAQAQRARDREEARTLSGFRNVLATPVHLSRWRPWINCARALLQGEPLWVSYGRVPGFENAVRRALEKTACDVLHVEHVRSLFLLPLLREIRDGKHRPALVFDSVDCISELFRQYAAHSPGPLRRLLYRRETPRMRAFESTALRLFDRVIVTSELERKALAGLMDEEGRKVQVVPNGVDLEYFSPSAQPAEKDTLLFSGRMSFYNNAEAAHYFAREIFPLIKARRPAARLILAGADPGPRLRKLGENPDIEVTGFLEDLRPCLRRAAVVVCPMLTAVGVQNKVLEAMAMGKPVVATPLSCRALAVRQGEELVIAQGKEEFAGAVIDSLERPEVAREIGRRARAHVEKAHDWAKSGQRLEEIYAEALAARAR